MLKYKARFIEMNKYKDNPEYFLTLSGFMNEYVQAFMMSHNYHMEVDPN
jgi:hypothetical protein